MYVHIALYKWKPAVKQQQIVDALNKVKELEQKVPGIIEISWGKNTSKYSEGYTHVILIRAENQAAVAAYRNHPDHAKVAEAIEAMESHGIGVDFEPN